MSDTADEKTLTVSLTPALTQLAGKLPVELMFRIMDFMPLTHLLWLEKQEQVQPEDARVVTAYLHADPVLQWLRAQPPNALMPLLSQQHLPLSELTRQEMELIAELATVADGLITDEPREDKLDQHMFRRNGVLDILIRKPQRREIVFSRCKQITNWDAISRAQYYAIQMASAPPCDFASTDKMHGLNNLRAIISAAFDAHLHLILLNMDELEWNILLRTRPLNPNECEALSQRMIQDKWWLQRFTGFIDERGQKTLLHAIDKLYGQLLKAHITRSNPQYSEEDVDRALLFSAIDRGCCYGIDLALQSDLVDPNTVQDDAEHTPLQVAILKGELHVLEYLCSKHLDLRKQTPLLFTCQLLANRETNVTQELDGQELWEDVMRTLIKSGADAAGKDGCAAIDVLNFGDEIDPTVIPLIKRLLKAGARISKPEAFLTAFQTLAYEYDCYLDDSFEIFGAISWQQGFEAGRMAAIEEAKRPVATPSTITADAYSRQTPKRKRSEGNIPQFFGTATHEDEVVKRHKPNRPEQP